jgi:hypothetical protein
MHYYRRLVIRLKRAYPQYKVTIRRVEIKSGDYGFTGRYKGSKDRFWITIANRLNESDACHALTHEFAHVPPFEEWERTGVEHNPVWAYHHGVCYEIFEKVSADK